MNLVSDKLTLSTTQWKKNISNSFFAHHLPYYSFGFSCVLMFVFAVVKEWHYLLVLAEKKNSLNHVCLGSDNFCWRARRNMPAQVLSVRNNRAKWLFPLLFGWITFTKGRKSRCPQSSFLDAIRCIKNLILGINVIECWSFQHRLIEMMRSPGFVFEMK